MRVSRRRLAIGLTVGVLSAGLGGWVLYDNVLDLDGCDSVGDQASVPEGSCAPAFHADDFSSGRATLRAFVRKATHSDVHLGYRYSNRSSEVRSLDWTKVNVMTPDGRKVECWGDDSALHYEVAPTETVEVYGGCDVRDAKSGTFA